MRISRLPAICALAGLFLAAPASSAVLFSNLGPGGAFSATTLVVDLGQLLAMDFTAVSSGDISSIRIPLLGRGNPGAPLTLSLRAPGAAPTGAILDSWTLTVADLTDPSSLVSLTPHTTVSLVSGTTYWMRAESNANSGGTYGWSNNSTGDTGRVVSNNQGLSFIASPTATALALEVNADPRTSAVPEPASIGVVLCGLGLIGCSARMRRKNN